MFRNLKIFNKVFISHTAVGLVSVISLSVIFYLLFQQAIIQRTIDQLSSINILKKNQIEEYLKTTKNNIEFFLSQKNAITSYANSSARQRADHDRIATEIETLRKFYDFRNVVVIDSQGNEIAFAGDEKEVHNTTLQLNKPVKEFRIQEIVLDSGKRTAILYKIPIENKDKAVVGHLIIEENFDRIQNILLELTGMGNTGESYLVGRDLRMRSRSRFNTDKLPAKIIVNTISTKNAFAGNFKGDVITDYRQVKVLSVARKIEFSGLSWVLVSEIDFGEAMQPLAQWRNYILLISLLIIVIIFITTFFISNAISKPILYLKNILTDLSKGIIASTGVTVTDNSEIGQIALATDELIKNLKRTAVFANEIGSGNFEASFNTLSDQDMLGLALIRMRDELKSLTEGQVKLLREKTSLLLQGQEYERKRIVQELHDGVGQLLTVIRLQIELIEPNSKLKEEILHIINETLNEVKRISYNVMPNAIVDFGLEAALKGLCENSSKYTPLSIDFKYVHESDHVISFEISIAIFRIIQEGLNNILKHSRATHVDLHIVDNADQFYFLLKDNGIGFNETLTTNGMSFGLKSMRERANLLNGSLEVHSQVEQGTIVEVIIPLQQSV